MFEIAATNLKIAREKGNPKNNSLPTKLQPGDTVLVQDHTKGPFDPKYMGDYQVVAIKGNQIEVRLSIGGCTEMKHVKHVKYILPADQYFKQIPDFNTGTFHFHRTCIDCQRQAFKLSELFIRSEDNQTTMPLYGLLS